MKKIVFLLSVLFTISILIFGGYYWYKIEYPTVKGEIINIDSYGDATLRSGEVLSFRGHYICDDGKEYNRENYKSLNMSNIYATYKITEEGYKKVEEFTINNSIKCKK